MKTGIYKITDLSNNKSYIGQSVNIQRRFLQHLRKDTIAIDIAINQKGFQNFTFQILEECSKEELNEKEQYWIEYYDSFYNGYNANKGGTASLQQFYFFSKKTIELVKKELKTTNKSIFEIANQYNMNKSTVYRINVGEIHFDEKQKYPLREKLQKILSPSNICKNCGKKISPSAQLCLQCYKKEQNNKSKINQTNRQQLKNKIRTLSFTTIAKQYNVTDNAIRKWCDKFNLPRTKKEIKSFSDQEWQMI